MSGRDVVVASEQIGPAEYRAVMDHVLLFARLIENSELIDRIPAVIDAAQRADTLGPIVDPTLWMDGHGNLRRQVEILRAVLAFRDAVRKAVSR